jgi:hypothetical protein
MMGNGLGGRPEGVQPENRENSRSSQSEELPFFLCFRISPPCHILTQNITLIINKSPAIMSVAHTKRPFIDYQYRHFPVFLFRSESRPKCVPYQRLVRHFV